VHEVNIIADWTGVDRREDIKSRASIERLRFARVLEDEPHLLPVWLHGNVWIKRVFLHDVVDDLMIRDIDDDSLRNGQRANVPYFLSGKNVAFQALPGTMRDFPS
jgi:hypothetical protein